MSTLQTQYKNYLEKNPDNPLSYEEWFNNWSNLNGLSDLDNLTKSNCKESDPRKEFQYLEDDSEDLKDWDVTLTDGLDDE